MKLSKKLSALILAAAFTALPLMANAQQPAEDKPIVLKPWASLFFGGTVQTLPNGETFHGDHGYAQFYIPQNARTYPLIMWHGIGQSGRTYESTPDGREAIWQSCRAGTGPYTLLTSRAAGVQVTRQARLT